MFEFMQLIKVSFLQMLNAMQVTRGSRKRFGAVGALALIAFLALYLSGLYSNMLGGMFVEAGIGEFFIPVMSLIVVPLSLVLTLQSAGSVLFGGKDTDFLLSLPVSTFYVSLSRMSALYLESLLFSGLWMIPVGVVAYGRGIVSDAGCFVRMIPAVLTIPLLDSLLSGVCGFLMTLAGSRTKHKALAQNLAGILLFLVFFLGAMQINNLTAFLLSHREEAWRLFHTWLLPFGLIGEGIGGSWGALLCVFLLCLVPFLAFTWLFSARYKRILAGLQSRALRSDYRLGRLDSQGQGTALLKKEIVRLFSTPAYLMNCCISVVMLVGFAVWTVFDRKNIELLRTVLGEGWIAPLFLICMEVLVAMIYPAAVSVSLEGKTLWILKEAPVDCRLLFASKAALNLVVSVPALVLTTAMFVLSGNVHALDGICMLLSTLALSVFLALAGLIVNLHFPCLDAGNDMRVVKNSASALIAAFGGLLFAGILVLLLIFTRSLLSFPVFCLLLAAVLCAGAVLLWKYLERRGTEIFREL